MGWNRRDEDWQADHERDLRKHDTLPSRLSPPIATALEVAIMCKGLKNIRDAEKLVEQYAQTVAAEARLQAVIDTGERMISAIDNHGAGNEPA